MEAGEGWEFVPEARVPAAATTGSEASADDAQPRDLAPAESAGVPAAAAAPTAASAGAMTAGSAVTPPTSAAAPKPTEAAAATKPPEPAEAGTLAEAATAANSAEALAEKEAPSTAEPEQLAAAEACAPPRLQECIAVCIDRSGSMGTPFTELTVNVVKGAVCERTRMEAVKVMFYAFRDRAESVSEGGHEMGLIQFDDKVERLLDLTNQLDRFERIVDDMSKRGQTAIYSSIVEAVAMLEPRFQEDPRIDLRVLVLTDGQNNAGVPPQEAIRAVNSIGAVVDAIIVGNRPDANLRRIVSATGGECWTIGDLGEGFELLEAESVVSLRARRGGVDKPPFEPRPEVVLEQVEEKSITQGANVRRAPVVASSMQNASVVGVAELMRNSAAAEAATGGSGAVVKRIMKELRDLSSGSDAVWLHSGDGVHVFPSTDNLKFWRALIEGPAGSPFEGGVFALNVILPDDYPFKPPKITFETPVYHCNVNDSGGLCLDILRDSWSPALTVPKCLEAIRQLLGSPNPDDAMRQWIAELTLAHQKTKGADSRYAEKVRESVQQHASKSVQEWRQLWGC